MDICLAFQLYFHMAQTHVDTAKVHVQIAQAGRFLEKECKEFRAKEEKKEKKEEKSVGQTKLESKEK